jgi:hypothetical protein
MNRDQVFLRPGTEVPGVEGAPGTGGVTEGAGGASSGAGGAADGVLGAVVWLLVPGSPLPGVPGYWPEAPGVPLPGA